jgi:hypothetical protein
MTEGHVINFSMEKVLNRLGSQKLLIINEELLERKSSGSSLEN